jgi:hypothetical protein
MISREDFIEKGLKTSEKDVKSKISAQEEVDGHLLCQSCYTGGMQGGNCWDDNKPYYISSDEESYFSILDDFLRDVVPEITYLKYLEVKKLVKQTEYTEYEYYGNTSEYKVFYIDLNQLYDAIF